MATRQRRTRTNFAGTVVPVLVIAASGLVLALWIVIALTFDAPSVAPVFPPIPVALPL